MLFSDYLFLMMKFLKSILSSYPCTIILVILFFVLTQKLEQINLPNSLFIISLILSLHLLSKINKIISFTIIIILTALITFDTVFAYLIDYQKTLGVFYSILETNTSEAKGVLFKIAFQIFLLFITILFLLFKSMKEMKKSKLKKGYSIIITIAIWVGIIPFVVLQELKKSNEFKLHKKDYYTVTIQQICQQKFPLIINDVLLYLSYNNEIDKFNSYKTTKKNIPEGIQKEPNKKSPTKIIVIIGESNSQSYFSLYGYKNVQSTPFLDSLFNKPNTGLSVFDGLASATITRDAVPFTLTFTSPQERNNFSSEKNVIDLASENGYSSFWVSSQEQMGIYDTAISLISTSCDTTFFHGNGFINIDDLYLAVDLKNLISSDTTKQLGIIHLISSHIPYVYYDEIDKNSINIKENSSGVLNDYLRCIHHTDRVIQAIYETMSSVSDDFVILYFSDHGESLARCHGYTGDDASKQLPIPLFCINKSSADVADIIKSYCNPQSNQINNTNISYILAELFGYSVNDTLKEKAIKSNNYVLLSDYTIINYTDLLKLEKMK